LVEVDFWRREVWSLAAFSKLLLLLLLIIIISRKLIIIISIMITPAFFFSSLAQKIMLISSSMFRSGLSVYTYSSSSCSTTPLLGSNLVNSCPRAVEFVMSL
jgi:hypothetical protein